MKHLCTVVGASCAAFVFTFVCGDLYGSEVLNQQSKTQVLPPALTSPNDMSIAVPRIDIDRDPIELDGALNEPLWDRIEAHGDFALIEPDTLEAPDHETQIRLAYTDRGLYIGASMMQPPDTLIGRLSGRDQREVNRDSINVTLDTSGTGLYGFWFGVALGDALMDGTVLPERKFASDWDGPWQGRSQKTETGWTAELFIPWGAVSMPVTSSERHIGLFVSRKVAYRDQRYGWPALADTMPKFMSALQPIVLHDLAPRQQYHLYPFVAVGNDRIDNNTRVRLGLDAFWRPSSAFQVTGTLNPDFGNVESDDVVINLTATETFFPEKRLFFLEGQEIFVASPRADTRSNQVGSGGAPYTMVNTRRIGGKPRAPTPPLGFVAGKRTLNQPTDLLGAAQVAGQIGSLRYGVLTAFEDDVIFELDGPDSSQTKIKQSGDDYGIGRALYEQNVDGAYVAAGVLSTLALNDERDAYVTGVDGHYLSRDGQWKFDTQWMTSKIATDAVGEQRGYGGFADIEYTYRKGMVQRVGLEYFDEHFDMNDVGFLERHDHYRIRSSFQLTSPQLGWARDNSFDIRGFLQKNISESVLTGAGLFLSDRLVFNDLSRVFTRLSFNPKQYDDLNSFGNGTFRIKERFLLTTRWDSDNTKTLSYGLGGGWRQENLGGDGWQLEGGVTWRPSDRFSLIFDVVFQDRVEWLLHQGGDLMTTFDAQQWQPKLSFEYFFNARQQIRASIQWVGISAEEVDFFRIPARPDDLIPTEKPTGPGARPNYDFSVSQFSFQLRYRWEIAPLSDLFLVYTRLGDRSAALRDDRFSDIFNDSWDNPLVDALVMKVRYRFGS